MQYIDCYINPISRQVSYPGAVIVQRDTNVEVLRFHFALAAQYELENDSIRVMVMSGKETRGFNAENVRTETNDGGDEELVFEHTITRYETEKPGQINVSVCGNKISGDTITEAWHTLNMAFQVSGAIHTDSDEGEDSEETAASNAEKIAALQTLVDAITSGRPIPVDLKSKMVDTSAIYLYTGNETGEQHNYWYYHDGTSWVPGSEYGGITVDDELSATSENPVQNKVIKANFDEVNGRLQKYDDIISAVGTGMEPLPTTFSHGNISTSSSTAGNVSVSEGYKYQAVTPDLIHFDRDCKLKVNSGYEFLVFVYTSDGTYSTRTGSWQTGEYTILAGTYFRILIRLSPADTSANVPAETFKNNIFVNSDMDYRVSVIENGADFTARKIDASNNGKELLDTAFAHGRILTTTGHVGEVSVSANNYKYQAITPNVVVFGTDRILKANPGYVVQAWWYDENDAYVSRSANFVSEYTLVAGRRYRFFMRLDPADTTADVDVSIFQDNVYIVSEISERITEIEENPLSSFPDYIANNLAEKPLGALSKGYILLSCDDGTEGLATYTIPMLVNKNVPATFGLLKDSAVLSNTSYLATVVDAVENHGCVVAQHGSATWPTYTESALLSYFEETQAVFTEKGIGKTYGAICPGASGYDDTSALVKAVAGGVFGCVFSGNRTNKIAYGSYKSNGPRSNMYDLDRKSAIGFSSAADYQSAIDEAYDNHYLFCPFWHDYSIVNDTAKQAIIEGMIDYAKSKGLTFITTKDIPTII